MTKNQWKICAITGVLLVGMGMFAIPRLHAALLTYVYPPDKSILVNRSLEPADISTVGNGGTITITVGINNSEDVALRGFYYSDQVPNGWSVNTADISVNGAPVTDYTYEQGYADEIYANFTPYRWALEMPQGSGTFSPTHPIPASGGTAQIVYTMIVSGGTGSDYTLGHEAWAGWLTTTPTGTAVFGYQVVTTPLSADFTAEPRSGGVPLTVAFTDTSTGDPTSWAWDFGDGSPVNSQQHPVYAYTTADIYTVTLTITRTDPLESDTVTKANFITVTQQPLQADFSATSRSGTVPHTVQFTDASTGGPTAWAWNFGDESPIVFQQSPTHTYNIPGSYTVTLTVTRTDPLESDTVTKASFITVTAPLLQADFIAQPTFGLAPLNVQFTDLSVGEILTRVWDFGDGGTALLPGTTSVPHTYDSAGYYTVTLTIYDTYSSDSLMRQRYIHVTDVIYNVYLPLVLRDHTS